MQDSGSAEQDEHPLEGEGGEEDEYSDEDECSSQDPVVEHNDAIASAAEADEASGANDEAEKEELLDMSKVSVPDGGDLIPAPPCGSQESQSQEEADQDSGLALFQYFCAVRVPGFRAGLRLGGARRTSPRGRRR